MEVLSTSNGSDNELNGIENHVILGQRIGTLELWNYSSSIVCGFFWAL